MTDERYPDDAALLAVEADEHTGVEYIRTGQSPYYLEFRRLLHRLLTATRRANDLRVYQDGNLSIGVRSGRCVLHNASIAFQGVSGVAVADDATTHLWLDPVGVVQSGTDGLPAERTDFLPLAKVDAAAGAIIAVEDLRGEAFLLAPDLVTLGVHAPAAAINTALADAEPSVTGSTLSTLTAGHQSLADAHHQHSRYTTSSAVLETFTLTNEAGDAESNVALAFSLPGHLLFETRLFMEPAHGGLVQRHAGVDRTLVGAVQVGYGHEGELTGSLSARLMGMAPIHGTVSAVILSAGSNLESSDPADHFEAIVKINGEAVTSLHPTLAAADGDGFRSTDQGDGVEAEITSDGTEQVQRGDVVTVDLVRSVAGTVAQEASDVAVLLVIRAAAPE